MNKTELLNKADELIKKANKLKELANQEENISLVPDEIKITKSIHWYSMWIINWNHELHYNYHNYHDQNWCVGSSFDTDHLIKCKLTPCKYEDLEAWDVFFRSQLEEPHLQSLFLYAIKINNWNYQFWDGTDSRNSATPWEYYWKVEALNINK